MQKENRKRNQKDEKNNKQKQGGSKSKSKIIIGKLNTPFSVICRICRKNNVSKSTEDSSKYILKT